jgi:EmrB/QacA subfamily drug resistance transporter
VTAEPEPEPEPEPTSKISAPQPSRRRWLVLAILCLGVFMLLLDGTIVNIAIPSMMEGFGTGFSQVEWVMNAYLLVFAVLLVTTGRFGDLYGRKRVFVIGLCLFTLASLACGLAPGIGWLIGFRALQGLGGAMMMPSTLSIIANVFPAEERGKAMGFWGMVSGFSLALGPSLGGLLVQAESWRWIFFINVPIGVLLLLLALRFIPESTDPTSVKQIDYPGVGVLTVALFCLTFALIEGQKYGWASGLILGLFAAAAVGLGVFLWIQKRQVQPLIELSMFKDRTFSVTNGVALILSFGMMGVFFLLPVFLQSVLGYSVIKAGVVMTPLAAVVIVAAPLSGMLSDRIGAKWLMFAGMLVASTGFFLTMRAMVVGASWQSLVLPFAVSGFGIGMVMPPSTSAVMGSVIKEKSGQASGVLSTVRQVGSVLGIGVMGALLQNRAVAYVQQSVTVKLDASPFPLSTEVKQQIVDAVSNVNIGQLQAGGDISGAMPQGITDTTSQLPASVAQQVQAFFKDLFGMDSLMTDFAHAMRTTYVLSIILVLVGAILVLAVTARRRSVEPLPEPAPELAPDPAEE